MWGWVIAGFAVAGALTLIGLAYVNETATPPDWFAERVVEMWSKMTTKIRGRWLRYWQRIAAADQAARSSRRR